MAYGWALFSGGEERERDQAPGPLLFSTRLEMGIWAPFCVFAIQGPFGNSPVWKTNPISSFAFGFLSLETHVRGKLLSRFPWVLQQPWDGSFEAPALQPEQGF